MAGYDQMILFGDSLFQHSSSQGRGFALAPELQADRRSTVHGRLLKYRFVQEYIRRLDVVNRGFSGYNTKQALQVLPKIIPPPEYARVRFLIIFLGANDACLEGAHGSQHVPITQYKQNLIDIVNHPVVTRQQPRIVLVTPPPINEYICEENDRLKGYLEPRRTAEHTALYADVVREVAQTQDVALLDLWQVFMKHAGWNESDIALLGSKKREPSPFLRMLLHDGLHFTNIAYTLLFQEIMRTIERIWPDQMPEKLPYVFPMWNAWVEQTKA